MRTITLTAALILAATSVLAQSAAEKSGINSLVGAAPKTEDFVKEVSMSDMYEIETSRLALERADAATKTFAQQMMQDHQKTTSELKQLLDSGKVKAAATSTMSEDQNEALGKLKELQGAEFTDEYRDNQIDAHEDAVDIFGRYADSGDNPDLKAWAAKTLPVLKHHLEMARALK
ncbi:DUF4142 domain-containing protein (plasmid) [Ensifer adhaerens]|uniref:DUF4142 domain-containing protein n=1 Tax=Ensifer adhaerens TaxID=106592 RepID=UPI001CBB523E|nr:DUF4142 domain-containing protein [Ensifer adhaerens]MBZ7927633.1 DUF4142 domain-containing protein [Ensifer adhaerens]UAX98032.1 DUF4142 domain-containing protein [Ensifer adhaerens]UAY05413.1 DUF4142 domain-containing protein [Ensifer adhaerens]UAY12791.1 DUF4142 domain-containing protein [Ensifer adhaerens]